MPDAIIYCDRCGHIIPPSEAQGGKVVIGKDIAICSNCASALTPEQRASILGAGRKTPSPRRSTPAPRRKTPRPGTTPSSRRVATATGSQPPVGARNVLLVAGLAAGVLAGIAVALLMARSGTDAREDSTTIATPADLPHVPLPTPTRADTRATPPTPSSPGRPVTAEATAAQRLEEIRSWRDETLSRYGDMRNALRYFAADYPDAPEVAQAAKLMTELDEAFDGVARKRLADAEARAIERASRGEFGSAREPITSLRAQLKPGPWMDATGARLFEESLERVDEKLVDGANARLSKARAAFEAEDYAAARRELSGRKVWPVTVRAAAETLAARVSNAEVAAAGAAGAAVVRFDPADFRSIAEKVTPVGRLALKSYANRGRFPKYSSLADAVKGKDAGAWVSPDGGGNRIAAGKGNFDFGTQGAGNRGKADTWAPALEFTPAGAGRYALSGVFTFNQKEDTGKAMVWGVLRVRGGEGEMIATARAGKHEEVDLGAFDELRAIQLDADDRLVIVAFRKAYHWWGGGHLRDLTIARLDAPDAAAEGTERPGALAQAGHGLLGEYFGSTDFDPETVLLRRLDARVDYDWGGGSPGGDIGPDWFSVRWVGEVEAPEAGRYTFSLDHDDGARLWVAGREVVSKGMTAGGDTATVELEKGWHPIRVDYVETDGLAYCRLAWRGPGVEPGPVPGECLRTPAAKIAEITRGDSGETTYRLPEGWVGATEGATDGNPYVVGGKPLWRADRVWPDDHTKASHYVPMTWAKNSWFGEAHNFAGHPALAVGGGGTAKFRLCGPWAGGHNGFKIPVLTFIAPAAGQYKISGLASGYVWEGAETVKLRVLKLDRARDAVHEVWFKEIQVDTKKEKRNVVVAIDDVTTYLAAGEELCFVPRFNAWHQQGQLTLKNLTISRRGLDTFATPEAYPRGADGTPLPGETGSPGQYAPGLVTEIFADQKMTRRVGARIDPRPDAEYGDGPPDLDAPKDGYAVRWSGWLYVPTGGAYEFEAQGRSHFKVTLDGRQLVSASARAGKARADLEEGLHAFSAELREGSAAAHARLAWKIPGARGMSKIGTEHYFHRPPEPGTVGPHATLVQGLAATFFAGAKFNRKVGEGDALPSFDSGSLAPCASCPADGFSIRMSGHLLVPSKNTWHFKLSPSGAAKLAIDGTAVAQGSGDSKGSLDLDAGFHEITVEYAEASGDSRLALSWGTPDKDKKVKLEPVYLKNLFHEAGAARIVDRRGMAPGMKGGFFKGARPGGRAAVVYGLSTTANRWGHRNPAPGVSREGFSALWDGYLIAPASGVYQFRVWRDGGIVLAVGGKSIVNQWNDKASWESAMLKLRAGKTPLRIMYNNTKGDCGFQVYWSGPDFTMRTLSGTDFGRRESRLAVHEPPKVRRATVVAAGPAPSARGVGRASTDERVVVVNGGFEEAGEKGQPAARWNQGQFGEPGGVFYVRGDATNPHGGKRAVVVKGQTDGAHPGLFTAIGKLPRGRYVVSAWVCADVGAVAQIHARLGGEDAGPQNVGEDYQQMSFTLDILEAQTSASLRLWTSTPRVRVWFDDVSVKRVR